MNSIKRFSSLMTLVVVVSAAVGAQTPPPSPQLTETEKIALQAITQKMQEIQKEQQQALQALKTVEGEIRKSHPGFELNEQTGLLVKVEEKGKEK